MAMARRWEAVIGGRIEDAEIFIGSNMDRIRSEHVWGTAQVGHLVYYHDCTSPAGGGALELFFDGGVPHETLKWGSFIRADYKHKISGLWSYKNPEIGS